MSTFIENPVPYKIGKDKPWSSSTHANMSLNRMSFVSSVFWNMSQTQQQSRLKTMLLAEELPWMSEQCDLAERCRDGCNNRISDQRARVAAMDTIHPHYEKRHEMPDNMLDCLVFIEARIASMKKKGL